MLNDPGIAPFFAAENNRRREMSMTIGAAGSVAGTSPWQTTQQDFSSMIGAIKSGNPGSAQQAFSALTGQSPTSGSSATSTAATASTAASDLLATIGQALASGNITAAQQALTTAFGQGAAAGATTAATTPASSTSGTNAPSGVSGHHHHHHRPSSGGADASSAVPPYSVTANAASTASGPAASTISTLA